MTNKKITLQELALRRQYYKAHPYEFLTEILDINVPYHQKKILEAIIKYNKTSIVSSNGIGKSYLLSALAIWFFYCYLEDDNRNTIVLFTAPTFAQVKENIYNQILTHIDNANKKIEKLTGVKGVKFLGDISQNKNLAEIRYGNRNYIMGVSNDAPNRNVGKHGTYVLFVFDEAQSIDEGKFTDFVGISSGGRVVKQVMIGNSTLPNGNYGTFYDSFKPGSTWHQMKIPCFDTPNFINPNIKLEDYTREEKDPDYWRNKLDRYCGTDYYKALKEDNVAKWEQDVKKALRPWSDHLTTPISVYDILMSNGGSIDSYEFLTRCRAEFPIGGANSVFPQNWIELAMSNYNDDSKWQKGEIVMGVDIGGGSGNDNSAITVRNGNKVIFCQIYNLELFELVDKIEEIYYKFNVNKINVEKDGIGKDKILLLQERGLPVVGVQMGGGVVANNDEFDFKKAENEELKKTFYRLRDRVWWNLHDNLNPLRAEQPTSRGKSPILLPDIQMLRQELSAITYERVNGDKIKIISKEELRKKLSRSSDLADSVILAFYQSDDDFYMPCSFGAINVQSSTTQRY